MVKVNNLKMADLRFDRLKPRMHLSSKAQSSCGCGRPVHGIEGTLCGFEGTLRGFEGTVRGFEGAAHGFEGPVCGFEGGPYVGLRRSYWFGGPVYGFEKPLRWV